MSLPEFKITATPGPTPPSNVPVASGVDPAVQAVWLRSFGMQDPNDLNDDIGPLVVGDPLPVPAVDAPLFVAGEMVRHRASGEMAVVLAYGARCINPAHSDPRTHPFFHNLPDCAFQPTGEYHVSVGFGEVLTVSALEIEKVVVPGA